MTAQKNNDAYVECKHIPKIKPDSRVTEEIAKEIGRNYRTLPEFEQGLLEHVYINHYSLMRNELLQCKWKKYKENIEQRVYAPFQFPNIRDLHFYKGTVRFQTSESIYLYPEHRMKLRAGPGVDFRGQIPIPQELLMKRGKPGKVEHKSDKKQNKKKN